MLADKVSAVRFAKSYDGANVAYIDHGGKGRPMVFLPGWCCTQNQWASVAERLGPEVNAVTLDYAGFGASGNHQRQWAIENFARDARAVIEALDLTDVIVVGHSMGGAVALELAYLLPDRVLRVIGADTFTYRAFYYAFDERQIDAVLAPLRSDFPRAVRELIGVYFLPSSDAELRERIEDEMAAADGPRACDVMENFLRWDVRDSLSRHAKPVQTINAKAFFDEDAAVELGLNTTLLEDTGHFIMLEKPQEFAEALLRIAP